MARIACFACVAALFVNATDLRASDRFEFASKEKAFTQGYAAFKGRQYEIAVPALQYAAKYGVVRAKFFLAKIYSDSSGGRTDHARAYGLLNEIIASHSQVAPDDSRIAPIVAQSLTAIARYERDGIKSLNLKPSTSRALAFFNHAAAYFDDEDAQFELAKHYLEGDGVVARVPYALNWLAGLSKRGHAGAQAFLADLYWDGRHTLRDPVRALALVTVAVENAKEEDRFWIEDLHQNIFCEADVQTRRRVHEVVGGWRERFGRSRSVNALLANDDKDLVGLTGQARRTCANGDIVGDLNPTRRGGGAATVNARAIEPTTRSSNGGYTLMRTRPNNSDKRALNGFVSPKDSNDGKVIGASSWARSAPRGIVVSPSRRSDKPNHSILNGFIMQGSTSSGFSLAPRQ